MSKNISYQEDKFQIYISQFELHCYITKQCYFNSVYISTNPVSFKQDIKLNNLPFVRKRATFARVLDTSNSKTNKLHSACSHCKNLNPRNENRRLYGTHRAHTNTHHHHFVNTQWVLLPVQKWNIARSIYLWHSPCLSCNVTPFATFTLLLALILLLYCFLAAVTTLPHLQTLPSRAVCGAVCYGGHTPEPDNCFHCFTDVYNNFGFTVGIFLFSLNWSVGDSDDSVSVGFSASYGTLSLGVW